jgi:hypothetical protein
MQLKEIDVFRPESLWDTARLAIGVSALGALLVDQVNTASFPCRFEFMTIQWENIVYFYTLHH